MRLKSDIASKDDVHRLVRLFYEKATIDPVIGHFFTTVLKLDWEKHIPLITNFWHSLLFGSGSYSGNPMDAHVQLNKLSPLQKKHFDQWVKLWTETIHENFDGSKAEEAIARGGNIAQIIHLKLNP